MSDPSKPPEQDEPLEASADAIDDGPAGDDLAMRDLLKRALGPAPASNPARDRELLASVQRKIRKRSRGKFYADGWSTSRMNYALIAAIMLVTILAVYLVLGPTGFSR